jgi:hypothetical protein
MSASAPDYFRILALDGGSNKASQKAWTSHSDVEDLTGLEGG